MSKNKAQASKLKAQADNQYSEGNHQTAIQLYSKAILLDNKNPALHNNRALSFLKLGKYNDALADAKQCVRIDHNFYKGYVRLIQTYLELDQKDQALEVINRARGLFQKNVEELQGFKTRILKEIELTPKSPKWEILRKWLYEDGAHFDKLTVAEFTQNYRGIMARKNITKKERILYIPLNRMITLEMGKELPISRKILSKNIQLFSPKHTFLALYLLYQMKKQNSIWAPYIALLPKQFPSFPMFFSKKDLQFFQGSPFLFMIHEKVLDLKRDYETLCAQQSSFKNFSFPQFCWARTAVCSRIFGLTINGIKTDALVPFADMINHRIPKQSSWVFVQKQNGFIMEAIQDIERGQQVFDSYGKKCNTRFLLNYGFVLENNDMNEVPFKVMLDNKDPLLHLKISMIGERPSAKIFKVAAAHPNDALLYDLLGYLRFRYLADQNVLNALKTINNVGEGYIPSRTPPINRNLQIQCWDHIQQDCQAAIKKYPTTLQQDQQKLKLNGLSENARNALILLKGQKVLFKHFTKMASVMKYLLVRTPEELKKELVRPQFTTYRDYLQKVLIPIVVKE